MARGNAALQKKLAELESEIGRLLEHPPSFIHDDIDGKVVFYQTAHKISFIKNFLTAEMDSHPGGRPEHLNHMAMRLSILEETFVNWAIPARFSILDETPVNRVESGDGNGAVNKSSDTSTSCSCTESCLVDEEFVVEDNVNKAAQQFGVPEMETILSQVSQVTESGGIESMEEGIVDEEEIESNQEEEKEWEREVEVTKDEKKRHRKQGEMAWDGTVEVSEDEELGRERIQGEKVSERKLEIIEKKKAREKQHEEEMGEERIVVKDDAGKRDRYREGKMVEDKVQATKKKGRWNQEEEMVGERKFESEENKGSERKEGASLGKDEKKIERNQERRKVGDSIVEAIDDKQEESKDEGEMMRATVKGRQRKQEAEMARMQKIEIKKEKKGRERKQQSYRIKNCMAMGCAAAAGFAIALIGMAVTNIFSVEETVYLFPT